MSESTSKILVPVGFSDQSIHALDQACSLARIKNSKIVLLSVIEEFSVLQSLFIDDQSHEVQKKVNDKLNEIAQEYSNKYNIYIETMVAKGKVYNQINEVAEMISADLIVMGTDGTPKGRVKRFIGSNAERVVRLAQCPVITLKGSKNQERCNNIILPLDLGKETKEKVTHALQYARYWGATIRIVSVLLKDNKEIEQRLVKTLNQVEQFITEAGVSCTAELVKGDKKTTLGNFIINYQDKYDSSLVIIMTKKEELSLSDNISVTARYIINNSQIPVMSVRPKKRNYRTGPTTAF
jgi:nucleotide-binding universal stress UspA family protein